MIAPTWVRGTDPNIFWVWVVVCCRRCVCCRTVVVVRVVLVHGFNVFHNSTTCTLVLGLVDSDLLAFVVVFCCGSILRWLMYSWWLHLVEIKSWSFRFSWLHVGFDLASDWTILFGWGWSQLVGIIHYDDVRHYSNLGLLFIGIFNLLVCNSEFDLSCCCFCVIMVWFVETSSSPNS